MGVEYASVREFVKALGKVPPELRKQLRPALRGYGEVVRADMRARAAYSTRIPGAIGMTVNFSPKGGGVRFRVDHRRAPHARALEGLRGKGRSTGYFRHPVFGDRETWVSQPTRPYFFPALTAGRRTLEAGIMRAVGASLRKASQ